MIAAHLCIADALHVVKQLFLMSALRNAVAYCCLTVSVSVPLVNNIDVSSTANLYKSLAQAAPEIKQCVDACNFIAESTRQQNNIGSVSVTSNYICRANCLYAISISWTCLFIINISLSMFFRQIVILYL